MVDEMDARTLCVKKCHYRTLCVNMCQEVENTIR